MSKLNQVDITLTSGYDDNLDTFSSTDNITNLIGTGNDMVTALRDHIVELILYYENKLEKSKSQWQVAGRIESNRVP